MSQPKVESGFRQLPLSGVALIKFWEKCYLQAYPDPLTKGKPYTIGWGSTRRKDGSEWDKSDRITQSEADELLIYQLQTTYLPELEKIPGWDIFTPNQKGALLSFSYNLGEHFFNAPGFDSISRMLRSQDWSNVREIFIKYRNPGTDVEDGLRARRIQEAELFMKK